MNCDVAQRSSGKRSIGSSSSLKYFFSLSRAVGKWRLVFRETVDITQKHLGILVFVCFFSSPLEGRFSLSLSFIIIVIISERRTTNQQDVGNHKSLSAFSHIPRRMQISEAPLLLFVGRRSSRLAYMVEHDFKDVSLPRSTCGVRKGLHRFQKEK